MAAYEVALIVHILGVVTLFGGLVILQLAGARLRRAEAWTTSACGFRYCARPAGCSRSLPSSCS
jgi:hypothetical protein